ncbi:maltose phosphorylase [Vibrio sp. JCM 19052]|nr:maltose phosphorylase [Vibrio sp. JCM 19052]
MWQYYQITGDQKFMDDMGYEIMFDTATFWTSRLDWLEDRNMWGICDVIGLMSTKSTSTTTRSLTTWR